ncbi:RT14 protein, partial [Polypterus senegalus]
MAASMWRASLSLGFRLLQSSFKTANQEVADKEIAAFPKDSCPVRIRNRCVITSRPRGVKRIWRLSRIMFRQFADHSQMSGIQRAMW